MPIYTNDKSLQQTDRAIKFFHARTSGGSATNTGKSAYADDKLRVAIVDGDGPKAKSKTLALAFRYIPRVLNSNDFTARVEKSHSMRTTALKKSLGAHKMKLQDRERMTQILGSGKHTSAGERYLHKFGLGLSKFKSVT